MFTPKPWADIDMTMCALIVLILLLILRYNIIIVTSVAAIIILTPAIAFSVEYVFDFHLFKRQHCRSLTLVHRAHGQRASVGRLPAMRDSDLTQRSDQTETAFLGCFLLPC